MAYDLIPEHGVPFASTKSPTTSRMPVMASVGRIWMAAAISLPRLSQKESSRPPGDHRPPLPPPLDTMIATRIEAFVGVGATQEALGVGQPGSIPD